MSIRLLLRRPVATAGALVLLFAIATAAARIRVPQSPDMRMPVASVTSDPQPRNIPYADARRLFDELRPELIPADLRNRRPTTRQSAWPRWVMMHDAAIRARLFHGYEDSIVNLLFFGTRFTAEPRLRFVDIPSLTSQHSSVLDTRLQDLIAALVDPGANGRLLFVRSMISRRGIDPSTNIGRRQARDYISSLVTRFVADRNRYDRLYRGAKQLDDPSATLFTQSTMYRDRGLSSDTSIFPDFALDVALNDLRSNGLLESGSVRRVGIIGPGLDFVDKDEGYDFYPQQTIQPFAVIDSVTRLGLATIGNLHTTAFDLNPRVTQHLEAARLRARAGEPYVIQLARNLDEHWLDPLVDYWNHIGASVGMDSRPIEPPPNAGTVAVRGVRLPPAIVLSVAAQDLNIVLQRVEPLNREPFDLIVATNTLVYYDVFEQSLALANIGRMLRPGGIFLTNHVVLSSPSMVVTGYSDVPYTDRGDGDRIWWYQNK